jgi:hypothetical protein
MCVYTRGVREGGVMSVVSACGVCVTVVSGMRNGVREGVREKEREKRVRAFLKGRFGSCV